VTKERRNEDSEQGLALKTQLSGHQAE